MLVFVSSAALVPQAAFGLRKDSESPHAPAPEWLTAVGFSMLTSKASLLSQEGLPQTCPSVCLLLPSAEMPTKLLSTEPAELENFSSYLKSTVTGEGHVHYLVVPVVGATALATEEV